MHARQLMHAIPKSPETPTIVHAWSYIDSDTDLNDSNIHPFR